MIKLIQDDVLKIPNIYICHQVNCRGVMGAGLAKQIKEKWPWIYDIYKRTCDSNIPRNLLGTSEFIRGNDMVYIVNMYAQIDYGRDKCYTDYKAFKYCLMEIAKNVDKEKDIILINVRFFIIYAPFLLLILSQKLLIIYLQITHLNIKKSIVIYLNI